MTKDIEYEPEFTEADFEGLSREEIIDIMREWFFDNFEDPAERTPYESAEGGYIYIWGGPYYAQEELSDFSGLVEEELIEELVSEINSQGFEWAAKESPEDYEDSYLSFIGSDNESFSAFTKNVQNIQEIAGVKTEGDSEVHLLGMLFVNVITAMETYLSDLFINEVLNCKEKLVAFVESNPDFQSQTFKLSEVFKKHSAIEQEVKSYLLGLMWHNIAKVKPMFKDSLNTEFPKEMSGIFKAVKKRHDLVHRAGKDKDGNIVSVTREELSDLINSVKEFVGDINEQIQGADRFEF